IRNSNAYKEYYAVATRATPPKPKASVRKTRSSSDTIITPPTAVAGPRLTTSEKGKQAAKASKAKILSAVFEMKELVLYYGFLMYPLISLRKKSLGTRLMKKVMMMKEMMEDEGNDEDDEEEGSDDKQASDQEEFIHPSLSTHTEEETKDEESFNPISNTPENTDDKGNGEENLGTNVGREEGQDEEDEADELYRDSSSVSSQFVTSMLNPTPDVGMESIFETTSQMDIQTSTSMAPFPVSAPTINPSTIATVTIIQQTPTLSTTAPNTLLQDLPNFGSLFRFDHRLNTLEANFSEFMQTNQFAGAVSSILRISVCLRDEAQKENDEFLKTIDENMQKMIKEQVKEQVSKILPKIEQTMNEQLEAEVFTRSSNSTKTSYVVAADLSEMELKKILIEKIEGNKSIQQSNEQRNLYKALVEAYESNKIILYTYGDTVTLKRCRDDDADKDEEPFAGPDRGSKRCREGKEPESASAPKSAIAEEPMQATFEMEEPSHLEFEIGADDQPIIEPSQHPEWFSQQKIHQLQIMIEIRLCWLPTEAFNHKLDWVNPEGQQYPHNLLKPLPLIPDSRGLRVIPFDHFINNDLEYLRGACPLGNLPLGRKRQQFYGFAVNRESARDVYSKRRIIAVTKLKIVEWHNYKHLDWITVRRDDDKLYNIVIQRRVEDLQLDVESYQKKINLTKPDTYRSDLKHKEAYIAYSNPRGFIYQNKDKQNRLMQIDELHKFSDGTLIDVRTALDDRLKGIWMKYLQQSIWRKSVKPA
nr:hypothetical protein [Tanacetum cinerariifolium]